MYESFLNSCILVKRNSYATLLQILFSFDQDIRVEKTLIQTLASQLSSTLMQLLFSFDQDMRVGKTLIQTMTLTHFLATTFQGWKTERVVEHFDDGRVIVVLPQDAPAHLNKVSFYRTFCKKNFASKFSSCFKVASVRTVVDDELGFSSEASQRMQESKVL